MNNVKTDLIPDDDLLVVDDSTSDLKLLSDILSKAGYTVRPANDGKLALRSIEAKLPAMVLSDVSMPGLDGFELCRRLKGSEKSRDIPVIFLSVSTNPLDKEKAFNLGGVDYISKPFEPKEVLARVRTHIQLRTIQQELEVKNIELVKSQGELEKRVTERTIELSKSNEQLQLEVAERKKLIVELQKAIAEVKTLKGFLPICASCKNIRDDKGFWSQVEEYISAHSDVAFTHSICPECVKKLYPGMQD